MLGLDDVPQFEEQPETGATFEENARDKAVQACQETGLISVADDSGLAVDALNGMPGVLSARWSGRHGDDRANTSLLLGQLTDVPDDRRGAAFVTVLAVAAPNREPILARAEWRGQILRKPVGENGFGYDPVFLPDDADGRSSAQLSPAEKDARSHRGRAIRRLLPELRQLLSDS